MGESLKVGLIQMRCQKAAVAESLDEMARTFAVL
jgi:hypothetical protein